MSDKLKDAEIDHLRFRNKDAEAAVEIGIAALESKNAQIRDLLAACQKLVEWYGIRDNNEKLLRPEEQKPEIRDAMVAIAKSGGTVMNVQKPEPQVGLRSALTDLCDAYAACNGEDHPAYNNARALLIPEAEAPEERMLRIDGLIVTHHKDGHLLNVPFVLTNPMIPGVFVSPSDVNQHGLKYAIEMQRPAGPSQRAKTTTNEIDKRLGDTGMTEKDEYEVWGWVIPRGGKKKPIILSAFDDEEISAICEEEIHGLGYYPLYIHKRDIP